MCRACSRSCTLGSSQYYACRYASTFTFVFYSMFMMNIYVGSMRSGSIHKPSPPVRRNSSLGGMMHNSHMIRDETQASSVTPGSGSNTPTPQPSPSATPKVDHPTGVINLNSILPQQNEVIYMQPHFHLQPQVIPTSSQPQYQAGPPPTIAPQPHYQQPSQQPQPDPNEIPQSAYQQLHQHQQQMELQAGRVMHRIRSIIWLC